jgi:Secretion system C-terminal sorting domain
LGLIGIFSNLKAQDLCIQFGQVNLTKPSIVNGNSSSFGTGLTNEVLEISGTFTVSGTFKFERCTIRMAPNASINVTTTGKFEVLDCKIYTCSGMWNGIVMPNLGRLNFWRNELEDASTGLDITNPKYCVIHNNDFNSNDVSIRIKDYNGICSFGIAGNHFNEDWVDMNSNSLITNLNFQSFVCFWITNCSSQVPIGLSGYPRNVIHGKTGLGVLADASKICMSNTQIGVTNSTINFMFPDGIGFLARNNSEACIHGLGSSPTSDPTFINSAGFNTGIWASNSTLKCYNTSKTGGQFIRVENTQKHWFDIANNRIFGASGTLVAIYAEKGTSGGSSIRGNTITNSTGSWLPTTGIRIKDVSNSQTALAIENNRVTVSSLAGNNNYVPIGIFFESGNSSNNYVRGNRLFFNGTGTTVSTGIQFTGATAGTPGNENRIQNNYIGETDLAFTRGINIVSTPNAFVCDNKLIRASTGIRLNQNCMNTHVGANVFSATGERGLFLDGNGIALGSINDHKGNRWEGSFSDLAAKHSGTDPLFSPFRVNDDPSLSCGNSDYLPNSNGTPSVTANWFTSAPGCLQGCGIQSLVGGSGGELDFLDKAIIEGTYAQTGQSPASEWHARYSEYQKIANNPDIYGNNAIANSFLESMQGSAIAGLYAFENLISEAHNATPSIETNLQLLYDQSIAQHDVVEAALIAHLADQGNTVLESAYFAASNTDNQIHAQISAHLALEEQEKETKLAQAEVLNNQILPGNDFEMYMRNVNNLRIKRYKNQLYSEKEKSELLGIAMKCYEEAGQAIYFARAMLPNIDTSEYVFPSDEFCTKERTSQSSSSRFSISVYPNPVSSELMVSGLGNNEVPLLCTVFDLLGRGVQQTTLVGNDAVPFQHLKPGTYILQLMATDGRLVSTHMVVKMAN